MPTQPILLPAAVLTFLVVSTPLRANAAPATPPSYHGAHPYLALPESPGAPPPATLSQTGAFKDVAHLVPSDGLIPYDINVSFWSDGAEKFRWCALPESQKVGFAPSGEWTFPDGTVFVKHFEIATNETNPALRRRLETRLIVRIPNGGVYGLTYKWREDNRDADLLQTNLTESLLIQTASGVRTQLWYYPSRQDCLLCHTLSAGGVLGVKTRQMNRDFSFPSNAPVNQLLSWNQLGLFSPPLSNASPVSFASLARPDDTSRSLEDRARSYLDANCAQCHRPKGTVADFDARYDTPLARQKILDGPVLLNEGVDHARVIAPNDIWRSILFTRITTLADLKMPPLARNTVDERGVALIRTWIESLPGPPVLPPPSITPAAGHYDHPIVVRLDTRAQATVRYTLDGSTPTEKDSRYVEPFTLSSPAIVRAKAFRPGYTRSVTAQAVYVVGN